MIINNFDNFYLDLITKDLSKLSEARLTLRNESNSETKLFYVNQSLARVTSVLDPKFTMNSWNPSLENLSYRVENMLRDLASTVKSFIKWLLERFRNIFAGKTYSESNASKTLLRHILPNASKEKKRFHSTHLNKFFSFSTEEQAIAQLRKVETNLLKLENFLGVFDGFSFKDYLQPETEANLKDDLYENFTKNVFNAASTLDANTVSTNDEITKGFIISEKLTIGLKVKTDNTFTLVKLPVEDNNESKFIDIIYNFDKGFGFALNSVCEKSAKLVSKINTIIEAKSLELKKIEKDVTSERVVLSKNILIVGKIYEQWGLVASELDLLVGAFNKALDQIEGKDVKDKEAKVKVV